MEREKLLLEMLVARLEGLEITGVLTVGEVALGFDWKERKSDVISGIFIFIKAVC